MRWRRSQVLTTLALGVAAVEGASPLCAQLQNVLKTPQATSYCRAFLPLPKVVSRTTTTTRTLSGKATTTTSYATRTATVTPASEVLVYQSFSTRMIWHTPARGTTTVSVEKTAYLDDEGNTLTVERRGVKPTAPPEQRRGKKGKSRRKIRPKVKAAVPSKPSGFNGLSNSDITSACRCLGLPSTTTRTVSTKTSTVSPKAVTLTRTRTTVRTLPTHFSTTTRTSTRRHTVTARQPLETITATELDDVVGCPPELEEQYVCPYNLADDDGSLFDQSQLACGVVAADGFQGYCVYNMDGTDSAGTLYLDGGNVQYSRPVNYGDGSDDDCPPVAQLECVG